MLFLFSSAVDIAPAKPEEAGTTAAGLDTLEDSLAQYDSDRDSQLGVEDRSASGVEDGRSFGEQHGESEYTNSSSGYYLEEVWNHRSRDQEEGTGGSEDGDAEEVEEENEDARQRDQPNEEAECHDEAGAEAGYDSAEEELDDSSPSLGCEARLLRPGKCWGSGSGGWLPNNTNPPVLWASLTCFVSGVDFH